MIKIVRYNFHRLTLKIISPKTKYSRSVGLL